MGDTHLPPQLPASALPDVVLDDTGGWISGPCLSFDHIPASDIRAGDELILDGGLVAEVDDVMTGDFWLNTGNHGPAVAIGWQESGGTASGTMFRLADDTLHRVRGGR
jgi:hypothetical protein